MTDDNPFGKHKKPAPPNEEEDNPFGKHKKPTKKNYTWGEALRAAPGSAMQGIADVGAAAADLTYDSITDPAGTWKRMGNAAGSMVPAMVTTGIAMSPWAKALPKNAQAAVSKMSPPIADLVGQYYAGYLDGPELRRRIAEHPIATAADIATVGTLPGFAQAGRAVASKMPAAAAHAANAARYVAVPSHAVNDAAGFAAGKVVPKVANRVVNALNPTKAMVTRAAEGRAPQALAALRSAAPIVPGSAPTTAQALTPAGTPGLSAIAQAAQRARPAEQLAQATTQNQARVDHLGQIGYPDWNLRTQVLNRDLRSSRDYAIAGTITSPPDQAFFDLMQRPSMQEAYRVASRIAAERNYPFPSGNRAVANQATHNAPPGSPSMGGPGPQPGNTSPAIGGPANPHVMGLSGGDIHLMKQVLDDLAFDGNLASRYGVGRSALNAIKQTRGEFLNWAENHNPAYGHARTQHRDLSIPIDQTVVRQELQRSLQNPALGDATIHQRGAAFANATRDAATSNPSLFRATGQRRYDNLDDLFDPAQMGIVDDVNRDFARAGLADQQATMGASEFGDSLNTIASDAIGVDLNGPYGWMARPLVGGLNRHLGNAATNAMMTPEGAAKLLEESINFENMKSLSGSAWRGGQMINAMINPARWANRYPAFYNALPLQQQQEPGNALAR